MEKYFEINKDNSSIKCKMYFKDINNINNVIISCHGFGGSKENNSSSKLAKRMLGNYDDVAVLTFDWPCHGKDVRQKLNLEECDKYLNEVINFVRSNFTEENIYAQATSFGGYLVLKNVFNNGNPFKKIILRCPAVNIGNALFYNILTDEDRENLTKGKTVTSGFERKIRISPEFMTELANNDITKYDYSSLSDDILICHGTKDELINFDTDKNFAESNDIPFIPVEGANHMFTNPAHMGEYINYVDDFFFKNENIIKR